MTNSTGSQHTAVVAMYLDNLSYVDNWDLVDSSAPKILGPALLSRYRGEGVPEQLWALARSGDLWRERVVVLATFAFIRAKVFNPTLELAEFHLHHPHDLMHKAIGWMLREIGKRDIAVERRFLVHRYREMPRTMLRYAIEKFPEVERKSFLNGTAGEARKASGRLLHRQAFRFAKHTIGVEHVGHDVHIQVVSQCCKRYPQLPKITFGDAVVATHGEPGVGRCALKGQIDDVRHARSRLSGSA